MKLPIIRQIQKTSTSEEIETTIKVLENIAAYPAIKDEDMDAIGELISNLCGALAVHQLISEGQSEKDAANAFMKKVMSSIN